MTPKMNDWSEEAKANSKLGNTITSQMESSKGSKANTNSMIDHEQFITRKVKRHI